MEENVEMEEITGRYIVEMEEITDMGEKYRQVVYRHGGEIQAGILWGVESCREKWGME
jgi:hypothetical protein